MQKSQIIGIKINGILLIDEVQGGEPPIGSICFNNIYGYFYWTETHQANKYNNLKEYKYPALKIFQFYLINNDSIREGDYYLLEDYMVSTNEKVYKVYQATKLKIEWLEKVKLNHHKIIATTNIRLGISAIPAYLKPKILYRIRKINSIIHY